MPSIAQTIYDALIFAGATPVEAAGIMGNMVQESSLNPEEQVIDSNGAYSRGLVMWNDLGAGSGVNWGQYITGNVTNDIVQQVLLLKAQGAFQKASGGDAATAAANFMNSFERPAAATSGINNRMSAASAIANAAQSGSWANLSWGTQDTASFAGQSAAAQGVTNTSGGGTINAATNAAGQNVLNGQPLTMADLPAVVQWINQNWAEFAWLLDPATAPGVAAIIEQAAVTGLSPDQVQAKIEATSWWKTTSVALRQFEQDKFQNPADYQFNVPGSKASQMYAQIAAELANIGVTQAPAEIQALALQALQYGWTTQQIQQALGKGANAGNAQQVYQQLGATANSYYQTISPQMEQLWAQQIAGGIRTLPEFQAQMAQQAAMKWTGYSQQLLNGYTMTQLTDNLRQEAAKTMEVDPNSINFTTDPTYQKVIDFAPPTPTGATQMPQHRVMTLSEMDQYLKGTPQWGYTQNARDANASIEQALAQNLGKIPGATL